MWQAFWTPEAALAPALLVPALEARSKPEPFLLLRQSGRRLLPDGGALVARWWRSPAVILRGWAPRETAPRRTRREALRALMLATIDRLFEWQETARSRRLLLSLDDRMLHDLGIDRATAHEEGSLPFWHRRG